MFKPGKRGKRKLIADYTLKDVYEVYKESSIPQLLVSFKTFKNICKDFNYQIIEDLVKNNKTFKIPSRLGNLRIKKSKMNYNDKNKLKVDWKSSREENKLVYHLNDHTDGYKYRFWWEKRGPIQNLSAYSFTPIRMHKRMLSEVLKDKNNNIDYFM